MGYLSAGAREFGVAIRSALVTTTTATGGEGGGDGSSSSSSSEMTLFAGAGIVPGSTARSEWAETGVKVRAVECCWRIAGRFCLGPFYVFPSYNILFLFVNRTTPNETLQKLRFITFYANRSFVTYAKK